MRYAARVTPPWATWIGLRNAVMLFPSMDRDALLRKLFPRGNPGAGVFHGTQNISKTLTYRMDTAGYNRASAVWKAAKIAARV